MARPNWTHKLTEPIEDTEGKVLNTLADARAYLLAQPNWRQNRTNWQHLGGLLLEAAKSGDTAAATEQIETALFVDARLKLKQ
jgi:hypothetical protein